MKPDASGDVAIHVSLKALVTCAISLGALISGAAWSVSATNTHVAEALVAIDRRDVSQDKLLGRLVDESKTNSSRIDVLSSRASRVESDVQELRRMYRGVAQ